MSIQYDETISFYTQGCRLNQSETAVIEQQFQGAGFSVVPFNQPSDIVVINTCTVTENGDSDAKRLVNRAVKQNPNVKIALVGCMAQIQQDKLLAWPNVNWVVGNAQKMSLPKIIRSHQKRTVLTPKMNRESFTIPEAGVDSQHTRANIKIQDGCDFYCSFCIIPFARGPARSREFEDILSESRTLVAAGHKEIVLTGINIGTYAQDTRTLIDVISAMEDIEGLDRIRISSIEPTTIPKSLLEKMAHSTKLCAYLHIPLQSATDDILQKMSRKYTLQAFDAFIREAKDIVPDICVGTDVIVGFPGETDELFAQTETYLRESVIDYFHVFSYSERQFARSKKMDGGLPKSTIANRSKLLRELSERKKIKFFSEQISKTKTVLFEQKKSEYWTGLTENYLRVYVKSSENLENQILPVTLKRLENTTLIGDLTI